MHNEWVQGKVLAIGNLHYNSKESMHKKNPYEDRNTLIEQSAVALITLTEHPQPHLETPL